MVAPPTITSQGLHFSTVTLKLFCRSSASLHSLTFQWLHETEVTSCEDFFCSLNRFVLIRTGKNLDCTFRVVFTPFFFLLYTGHPTTAPFRYFLKSLYWGLYIYFRLLNFEVFIFFIAFWVFRCICTSFNFSWPKPRLVLFSSCKYNIIKYLKWQVWLLWTQWRERSRLCSSRRMTQKIELWFYSASWTMSASSGRKWDKSSYFFVLTYRLYTLRILLRVPTVSWYIKSSRAPLKTIIVCLGEQWDLDADVRLWNERRWSKGTVRPQNLPLGSC